MDEITHVLLRVPCQRQGGILGCVDNVSLRDVEVVCASKGFDRRSLDVCEKGWLVMQVTVSCLHGPFLSID